MDDFSEQLIERYFDRVHAYVRLRVPEQDCEDMAGDIFLRAMERKAQLRGEAGAWLFSIARSRIADYYRDKREREPGIFRSATSARDANGGGGNGRRARGERAGIRGRGLNRSPSLFTKF